MVNGKGMVAYLAILQALLCFILAGCTVSTVNTGGSSGTEVSALVGQVLDHDDHPVKNAIVRIRPIEFLADSSQSASYVSVHSLIDTITDSCGFFKIDVMTPDSYLVEVVCDDTFGVSTQFRYAPDVGPVHLPALTVLPLALVSGNVQISYNTNGFGVVQAYGFDRTANLDTNGNFTIMMPQGNHTIHIGGRLKDSTDHAEFDGMDISFSVGYGEDKNIGSYYLKPPPPPPCLDGSCDSSVVRRVLDMAGLMQVHTYEVTKVQNGRIVEFNLRGRSLPRGIPSDVNRLTELKVLDLGQTGLPAMFPDMGRMTKLEVVRLDGDHIPMFSSGIGNCMMLKELNLSGNELTALPQSIVNLNGLTSFSVGGNRLCQVDSMIAAWIDRYDPEWRTNQRCQ